MKVALFDFQKDALHLLREKLTAARSFASSENPQAIAFSAPTGSDKTIVMTALFEAILDEPDDQLSWPLDWRPQPDRPPPGAARPRARRPGAAERRAKGEGGRDAFCLTLGKRAGGTTHLVGKWRLDAGMDGDMGLLLELRDLLAREGRVGTGMEVN